MEVARGGGEHHTHERCRVAHLTDASAARRAAAVIGQRAGLGEPELGRLAVVVTELATNLVKHTRDGGELLVRGADELVEVLAIDGGPGMHSVQKALEDGYSTAGSAGTGLGAVKRLSDVFDVYSVPTGTIVLARVRRRRAEPRDGSRFDVGGVSVRVAGETQNGDAWVGQERPDGLVLMVVDGLGHGALAAEAATAATAAFVKHAQASVGETLEAVHGAVRATRGAAAAVAAIDADRRRVEFAGIGNIAAVVIGDATSRQMVSMNGTVGHEIRRLRTFTYPFPANALVVMHSDGVSSKWDLASYPGVIRKDPAVVAAVILRDFMRERDDATVVVARERVA